MSELADVAGGQVISAVYTNQVKERTAMRYLNAAARDSSVPIPEEGALAYLADTNSLTIWNGTGWETVAISEYLQIPFQVAGDYVAQSAVVNADWVSFTFETATPATVVVSYGAFLAGVPSGTNVSLIGSAATTFGNRVGAGERMAGTVIGSLPAGSHLVILRFASVNQSDTMTVFLDPSVNAAACMVYPT